MHKLVFRLSLAILLSATTASAFAQFGGGMGGMGGGRRSRGTDGQSASRPATDRPLGPEAQAQQLRDRLYDLRVGLRITQEQSAAWQAFSDRVWDFAGRAGFAVGPGEAEQSAAQVLAQRAAQAQQRSTQLRAVADAAGKLYEALNPDQRLTADHDLAAVVP